MSDNAGFIGPYMLGSTLGGQAAATNLVLDLVPGAALALSTARRLRSDYTGACRRIRESGGNTEADIGFVGNLLDTAAADSHIGANSGFDTTSYDQSTNGYDFVNSTNAEQPQYFSTGVGGRPTSKFLGAQYLTNATASNWKFLSDGTGFTLFMVLNITVGTTEVTALLDTGIGSAEIGFTVQYDGRSVVDKYDSISTFVFDGTGVTVPINMFSNFALAPGKDKLIEISYEDGRSGDDFIVGVDGVERVSGNSAATPSSSNPSFGLKLGASQFGATISQFMEASFAELIIYPSILTAADSQIVKNNIKAFYNGN